MSEHGDRNDDEVAESGDDAVAKPDASGPPADYVVGYGRPPMSGRIKPGEVRNPRGKAKGTRSFRNDIADVLAMPVSMVRDGKPHKVTTRKAGLLKLREKALKGDSRSLDRVLQFAAEHQADDVISGSTKLLMIDDQQILANARERDRAAAMAAAPAEPATAAREDER